MATIVTLAGKGSPLTAAELDANFTNLNADKLEVATAASTYQPLDSDLTAIAAISTAAYGRSVLATANAAALIALMGLGTIATQSAAAVAITGGALDNVTLGVTTQNTARVTTLQANSCIAINTTPNADIFAAFGGGAAHAGSGTSVYGSTVNYTAPATATAGVLGYHSILQTAATAFTTSLATHFYALNTVKGAGSTITSAVGFYAANAMATGTNNYGFFSTIAAAANTWAFYGASTAHSYFGGSVGVGSTNAATYGIHVYAGGGGVHYSPLTTIYGFASDFASPTTNTASAYGFSSNIRTQATAYTVADVIHFSAASTVLGAGSTITRAYGFYAFSTLATGTNNYGFYSNIAAASNTFQMYLAGTAHSVIGGPLGVGGSSNSAIGLYVFGSAAHSSVASSIYGVATDFIAPTTATAMLGHYSNLRTSATAYTVSNVWHYIADQTIKGAGSTIGNVYGFAVNNAMATGTINYGFWSGISAAANTWAFFAAGTAASHINGNLSFGTTTLAGTSGDKVIVMANGTAPSTSPAGVGQLYVESGALKFRGSSGTVTTVAPA